MNQAVVKDKGKTRRINLGKIKCITIEGEGSGRIEIIRPRDILMMIEEETKGLIPETIVKTITVKIPQVESIRFYTSK